MFAKTTISWYDLGVPIEKGKTMFGFCKKRKQYKVASQATSTATSPDILARQILKRARQYALDRNIPLGEEFWYDVEEPIPGGVAGSCKVSRCLMEQAFEYGLTSSAVLSSRVAFIRLV